MSWLPDATLAHLRDVGEWPDLSGTRYEVVREIGRGGMGVVYEARDRVLERDVAIKVLSRAGPTGAALPDRLRDEGRILATLEHPGIVPVHDLGVLPDGRVFSVMKLVRGRRLDEASRDGGLTGSLSLFERVCHAVAFAHSRGIVHRDLKPENVMIGAFGEVLVLDWGVAKLLGDESGAASVGAGEGRHGRPAAGDTEPGTVMGTPGYMAPEQARGDSHQVDERTDVFALGGILQFLLTGCRPSEAEPTGGSEGWDARPRGLPPALLAVCRKARAERPADRYASADRLADEIRRFLNELPVTAHSESVAERAGRFVRRHRLPIGLIAAYLAMRLALIWLGGS